MTKEEIKEIVSCTNHTNLNDLGHYFKKIQRTPLPGKSQFDAFYNCADHLSELFCGCIFILDITKEKAKSLSNESGVWILSKDDIDRDAECLVLEEKIQMEDEDISPGTEYGNNDNGWEGLFGEKANHFPPINEMIIYDNFIKYFDSRYNKPPYTRYGYPVYIGLENLLQLFRVILPQKHTMIKILLACPKYVDVDKERQFEARIKSWIEEVKEIRDYDIIISILLIGTVQWRDDEKENHPLHPRVLYTDYFSIKTEKGFNVFDPVPFSNRARKDGDNKNSVSVRSMFSAPKTCSNPIKTNYNNKLKEIGEQLRNKKNNNIMGKEVSTDFFFLFEDITFEDNNEI